MSMLIESYGNTFAKMYKLTSFCTGTIMVFNQGIMIKKALGNKHHFEISQSISGGRWRSPLPKCRSSSLLVHFKQGIAAQGRENFS